MKEEDYEMKKQHNLAKNLFLAGLVAMTFVLVTPAVSADVFFPTPYQMGPSPVYYPVIGEPVIGSGSFLNPGVIVPANIPLASNIAIPDYSSAMIYPMNPGIINPVITGTGSSQEVPGEYYKGKGTSSGRFGVSSGFTCSF
jgi:hypothetical protein